MKREEKSKITRRRIMDGALAEFSSRGYGGSSINTICSSNDISKGLVYHNFDTKDDLFLTCVEECFQLLSEHIRANMKSKPASIEDGLEDYFHAHAGFFKEHSVYRRIFCEAVIAPPDSLREAIEEKKKVYDDLNTQILDELLSLVTLRTEFSREDVVETFRLFQDFINVRSRMLGTEEPEFELREMRCWKAMQVLLYGVVEKGGK